MPWHIIAQIGDDNYYPTLKSAEPRFVASIDKKGCKCSIAQNLLSNVFKKGLSPSNVAIDLLHLATVIYTADLRIWRGYNSEDAWTRQISAHIPVTDMDLWNHARPQLVDLLSFLTGDDWQIHFRSKTATPEIKLGAPTALSPHGVCLFSGGLDSFIGAIDLLARGESLALVGHYGNSQREQTAAFNALSPIYGSQVLPFWFYVLPPKVSDAQKVETTMRARSLLFLALGTAVASGFSRGTTLYIPENGLISLNVPLTFGRVGTHSTRTTHPHTIELYRKLLNALDIEVVLRTPYRFLTKGEMLRDCKNQDVLMAGVHTTMSCSRPQAGRFHGRPVGQHCGYCVPCIIRRAALNVVSLDCEPRIFDVLAPRIKPNEPTGCDKRAFQMALARLNSMAPLEIAGEIVSTGPIDGGELDEFIGVYKRGMAEVENFLARKE